MCDKYESKPDDIAPSVQVSHYDCSEMTENNLYSLNQVKPCNMAEKHAISAAQLSSANLMATASLSAPSLMDVAQHLVNQCLLLYL